MHQLTIRRFPFAQLQQKTNLLYLMLYFLFLIFSNRVLQVARKDPALFSLLKEIKKSSSNILTPSKIAKR